MSELKVGRVIYDINENDVVLFNGVCWTLMTRNVGYSWEKHSPTMSKAMCEKFVKKKILILVKKEKEYVTQDGRQMGLYYYKFDVNELEEFVNTQK